MTGDQRDIAQRLKSVLPASWFPDPASNEWAFLQGFANISSWLYGLITFAKQQTRVSTASGIFLDLMAFDFFGRAYGRSPLQTDASFSAGIRATLLAPKATRPGLVYALTQLTGRAPTIFYPAWGPDTGGYGEAVRIDRASVGTYFDSTGTLQTATINQARYTYNPLNLAAGATLLVEGAVTNATINSAGVGAVAGTPGVMPSGWFSSVAGTVGLSTQIVGSGAENGIPYVDLRFFGTATAGQGYFGFESGMAAASAGQAWTGSLYIRQVAGSLTNIASVQMFMQGRPDFALIAPNITASLSAASLNLNRVSGTETIDPTDTAIWHGVYLNTSGGAVDITLRCGAPQLEIGPAATSAILTQGVSLTRAADSQIVVSPSEAKCYSMGYSLAGAYGSMLMPYQCLVTAYRPATSGIPNIPGYGVRSATSGFLGGYGITGAYASISDIVGQVTDAQIYATVAANAPAGVMPWTRIANGPTTLTLPSGVGSDDIFAVLLGSGVS
jgi:hypothetical protein